MGIIREFTCPSCRAAWQVNIGHGINHATLNGVLGAFPQEMQEHIKKITAGMSLPLFEFNYHAALCPECGEIISVPVITFPETAQTFHPACPVCGGRVFFLSGDSAPVCPQCRKVPLSVHSTGRWD